VQTTRAGVARVQLLLEALFLEHGVDTNDAVGNAALQWVSEWLGLEPSAHFGTQTLIHLVAVQLAPRAALDYQSSNPRPRWRLIDDYLRDRFGLEDVERARISRVVATVLDSAATERGAQLISVDSTTCCAICRIPFGPEPASVKTRDPYKPVWLAPVELCRPEIDHVVPISSLGAHVESNMQIVCRACNIAKGNGLTIDPAVEVRYAGQELLEVPRVHLFRLLQWLIERQGGQCGGCGSANGELTMRPIHPQAPLARATLALRCYDCTVETPPLAPQSAGRPL
jgi:5-methylcytosine-specific restriction endonuclease McrA